MGQNSIVLIWESGAPMETTMFLQQANTHPVGNSPLPQSHLCNYLAEDHACTTSCPVTGLLCPRTQKWSQASPVPPEGLLQTNNLCVISCQLLSPTGMLDFASESITAHTPLVPSCPSALSGSPLVAPVSSVLNNNGY